MLLEERVSTEVTGNAWEISFSLTHFCIQSFIYISMDSGILIFWVVFQYYFILLLRLFWFSPFGRSCSLLLRPFVVLSSLWFVWNVCLCSFASFCFGVCPDFLILQVSPGSTCVFPVPVLGRKRPVLGRVWCLLLWNAWETIDWALGLLLAVGVVVFLSLLSWQTTEVALCVLTHGDIYIVKISICNCLCLY